MSSCSIAHRVHLNICAQRCSFGELIVPYNYKNFKTSDITQAVWFNTLRDHLRESIDLGVFHVTTMGQAVKKVVADVNLGCCQGLADCILVDKDPRLSMKTIAEKTFSSPERICYAQICYLFEETLRDTLRNTNRLLQMCDMACLLGKEYIEKFASKDKKILLEIVHFWETNDFSSLKKSSFVNEKFRLISSHVGKNKNFFYGPDHVVPNKKNTHSLERLIKKVRQLREEVLGREVPEKTVGIFNNSNTLSLASFRNQFNYQALRQVTEEEGAECSHVTTLVTHKGRIYLVEQAYGLVLMPENFYPLGKSIVRKKINMVLPPQVKSFEYLTR